MKHTKYSDCIILGEVERNDYTKIGIAFKRAAKTLNCRPAQAAAQYYKLKKLGITYDDVASYSQEDIDLYSPGDPDKIIRSYNKDKSRPKSPEGYDTFWKDNLFKDDDGNHTNPLSDITYSPETNDIDMDLDDDGDISFEEIKSKAADQLNDNMNYYYDGHQKGVLQSMISMMELLDKRHLKILMRKLFDKID